MSSAMLEFTDLIADFTTNRAVTHELVHHRLCSFAQESQRYVKYDNGIEFIRPVLIEKGTPEYSTWERSIEEASTAYLELLSYGCTHRNLHETFSLTAQQPDSG